MTNLAAQFEDEMYNTYQVAAKQYKYRPTLFLQMIQQHGGVGAAKILVAKDAPSDGFRRLWDLGRLDLTAEALILKPQYASLFTEEERAKARQRLVDLEYKFPE